MKIRTLYRSMESLALGAIVVMLLATVPGCAHNLQVQTPNGPAPASASTKAAYTADQVVVRLQELQNAVTAEADRPGTQLQRNTARMIVQFTVDAGAVLKTTPQGWYPAVSKLWDKVKADVPAAQLPAVQNYWSAVNVILAAFAP